MTSLSHATRSKSFQDASPTLRAPLEPRHIPWILCYDRLLPLFERSPQQGSLARPLHSASTSSFNCLLDALPFVAFRVRAIIMKTFRIVSVLESSRSRPWHLPHFCVSPRSFFISALFHFVSALSSAQSWDSQKILPPLITLLAAYLALVSFYRTTGWMIRTAFAFVKWGGIIATLAAGAGYFMANAGQGQGDGVGLAGGILPMVGNAVFGMLSGQGGAQQALLGMEQRVDGRRRPARALGEDERERRGLDGLDEAEVQACAVGAPEIRRDRVRRAPAIYASPQKRCAESGLPPLTVHRAY